MSRLNTPGIPTRPAGPNVYTGLAFISMAVSLAALIYVVMRFMNMGIFSQQ